MAMQFTRAIAAGVAHRASLAPQLGTLARRGLSEVAAAEEALPRESTTVQDLVEKGMAEFPKLPTAYVNIDPEDITFVVGKNFRGNPVPELLYQGQPKRRGLDHTTPWAVVNVANLGIKGTLGQLVYGSKDLLTDPALAKQRIGLCVRPRHDNETVNGDMERYIRWLQAIEERLCDHLASNMGAYPRLNAKYPAKDKFLKHLLQMNLSHRAERFSKDENGNMRGGTQFTIAEQELFRKAFSQPVSFACKFDQEVYETHNLVRQMVPLYDSAQRSIPISENPVERNYIVSCTISLVPSMFETFYGMKKVLETCTVLAVADRGYSMKSNPWAAVPPFLGGYRYEDNQ